MLTCLIDYVGLINCGGVYEAPESGLYINSLPGVSLESIDKIADSEQITFMGVWSDAQTEAAARFRIDFIAEVTKCYKIDPSCDYDEMICANKETLVNAWRYLLGNQLMIFRLYTTRLNRFTTVDKDMAKELRDHYQVEYEKALAQAVKLVDVSTCELCCGGNPETVIMIP